MEEEEHLFNKNFISVTVINFAVYLVYYLLIVIIAVIAQAITCKSCRGWACFRNLYYRDVICPPAYW